MTHDPFDRTGLPRRPMHGGIVAIIAVTVFVSVVFGGCFVRPRLIIRDFGAFVGRHPVGSSVEEMSRDSFIGPATMIRVDHEGLATRGSLQQSVAERKAGEVHLMWTHTPPFGRVTATFRFEDGRIVDVQTHDLD